MCVLSKPVRSVFSCGRRFFRRLQHEAMLREMRRFDSGGPPPGYMPFREAQMLASDGGRGRTARPGFKSRFGPLFQGPVGATLCTDRTHTCIFLCVGEVGPVSPIRCCATFSFTAAIHWTRLCMQQRASSLRICGCASTTHCGRFVRFSFGTKYARLVCFKPPNLTSRLTPSPLAPYLPLACAPLPFPFPAAVLGPSPPYTPVYPPPPSTPPLARTRAKWEKLIASAMLQEEWESARRLVSVAAPGGPRQTLARELIPAATAAGVFEVATRLIEDHNLVSEFPNYNELLVGHFGPPARLL